MRILQVHNRYRFAGGEDTVVGAEAAVLRAAGHEVVEHQADNPPGAAASVRTLLQAPWNRAAARAITDLVGRHRPDVAHVHNTWYALSPAVLAALHEAGVPVVMTLHNYRLLCVNGLLFRDGRPCEDCVGTHPWRGVAHRCYRDSGVASAAAAATIAVNRAAGTWQDVDLFLALTEFGRQRFVAGGLPAERIRVKPNFTDDPGPRDTPPSASSTVLYVGRLSPEKGVEDLLAGWGRSARAPMELVIVGDGPAAPPLRRAPPPGVTFTGQLGKDEVRARMLSARALAFPSRTYEGMSMVAVEALAAGLPVIGTNVGAAAEVIRPLGPAWLVAARAPDAWDRALGMLDDAGAVDAASATARAAWQQRYSPEQGLAELEDAYRTAMTRRVGT